jgi:hypothetical protein
MDHLFRSKVLKSNTKVLRVASGPFSGDQIEILESPLGSLATVGLVGIASTVTVTLVLPPVNMGDKPTQSFDTVAIKTESAGVQKEGAALSYAVALLHGVAQEVSLPTIGPVRATARDSY